MSIQFDPRLQGKQNTTDILSGQESTAQDAQAPSEQPQPQPNTQAAPAPQEAPQANLATQKPKASSGMYTNIQNYIQKNQPASQNMAKSIGSTVQRSADIARKNIQATQKQFGNLMEQGSLQNRESAVQDVKSAAQRAASMTAPQQAQSQGSQQTKQRTGGLASQQPVQLLDQNQESPNQPAQALVAQQEQEMSAADQRLKNILDAQYQGPQRLRELGSFGQAQGKAQEAERLRQQLTGGNQQELLDKSLERQGSQYTSGARRLDQLLFGQGEPQEYLQQMQQQIGDVGQDLASAQQSARQDAIQRARELGDIRSQAREALQTTATGRASEVEDYLTGQIEAGGQLADYYRDLLSGSEGGLDLSAIEAETLGVKSGAGLYNLLRNEQERNALLEGLDARDQLDRQRLISRDQQAQLAELQRLAQLSSDYGVQDSGLDFRSEYQDADLAQTQDAIDALNLQGFGDALTEAEQRFREEAARNVTGIGRGKEKYNRGWGRGRKTVKRTAYESANLKDILEDQGYDFESDPSQYISDANTDILGDLSTIANFSNSENIDVSDAGDFLDSLQSYGSEGISEIIGPGPMAESIERGLIAGGLTAGAGALGAGSALGSALGASTGFGAATALPGLGQAAAAIAAADLGSKVAESLGSDLERARLFGDAGALVGRGIKDVGREVQGAFSSIFGGGKSRAQKVAAAEARAGALRDLQRKLTDAVSSSGFANRINVVDTEETRERQRNLLDILENINNRR